MTEPSENRRTALVRESLMFQFKLLVDGLRDFVLVPISLGATVIGLLRSAEDPDREFRRVLDLGRRSEQWINLFGQHAPLSGAGAAGSLDLLVSQAEQVLREQVRKGDVSEGAGAAIGRALERLHRKPDGEGGQKS